VRLIWLTIAILVVLALAGAVALLWRRFYRDDPENAARRIFKNSAVTFGMRLAVKALDMVVVFVLLGTLAAPQLGVYNLAALLVSQYLVTFTDFGLGVWLTREVARNPDAAPRLFGTTLALRLALVVAGALPVALLVIGLYALLGAAGLGEPLSPEAVQVIWVLLLTLVPGAYSSAVTALYNAAERMEVPALMELVTNLLSFLARIAVITLAPSILGLAWAAVGVSCFTAAAFYGLQRRSFFPPTLRWDLGEMRTLLGVALPLMLNNLLAVVFFRFDIFIVRAFGGPQADLLVQQYTMPYQLLGIALILPPVVTFAVFPLLSRRAGGDRPGMADALRRTLGLLLALGFPVAMGLSVLAPELVRLFTRAEFPSYGPSVQVLAILAWFLPLSFANGLVQYALIAVDRQRAITRAFLVGAAFNFTANVALIGWASLGLGRPELGLYAAAVVTILSELVLYLVFRPLLRAEGLDAPLAALSWRPAVAALAMGAAMLAAKLLAPGLPGALLAALLAPVAYAGALWAAGGIGAEERALALRIIGRTPQ
jgi:O-antigen/teichoic acid export membrane protein